MIVTQPLSSLLNLPSTRDLDVAQTCLLLGYPSSLSNAFATVNIVAGLVFRYKYAKLTRLLLCKAQLVVKGNQYVAYSSSGAKMMNRDGLTFCTSPFASRAKKAEDIAFDFSMTTDALPKIGTSPSWIRQDTEVKDKAWLLRLISLHRSSSYVLLHFEKQAIIRTSQFSLRCVHVLLSGQSRWYSGNRTALCNVFWAFI